MNENLENEVITGFSKGSDDAFRKVYTHFYAQLLYFASKLTSDTEESEDIVAETFVKLFNRHELFDSYVNIRAFLYITVRNNCFNFLKHRKVVTEKHRDLLRSMEKEHFIDHAQIEGEMLKAIREAIEKLPAECKKVIKLQLANYSPSEIAQRLNIEVGTVYSQKSRAVKLLRINLADNQLALVLLFYIGIL